MSTSNKSRIPGRRSRTLARRLRRVESRNVTFVSPAFPLFWKSASGSTVTDEDGHRYLDLTAAFGVSSLGHKPATLSKAIHTQTAKLWHGMGDVHPSAVKVEFLEALARVTPKPLQKTILSSSGAEAVESALKTARLFTKKPGVLAFDGAYHGLTYGALAATSRDDFSAPFRDQLAPFVVHAPYPDALHGLPAEMCLRAVTDILDRTPAIGAILIEPMQARGGIRIPPPKFLKDLRALSLERGILLIVDEIYTGFGRTGTFLAIEQSKIVPDLLCLGKAMAGGYPISACIGSARVMDAWPESDGEAIHTSTFLGNPLGCAMGLSSIREIQKLKLAKRSRIVGAWWLTQLQNALADVGCVAQVRGIGLMVGIELVQDRQTLTPAPQLAGHAVVHALQKGLIILSGGNARNVLTLTPPLTISKQELTRATGILQEVLRGSTFSSR